MEILSTKAFWVALLGFTGLFGLGASDGTTSLPGDQVELAKLDEIRAMACGQFCSTQGQSACSGNGGCQQQGDTRCVQLNGPCGLYSGPLNQICSGADGSDNLCSTYTDTCSSVSTACKNGASAPYCSCTTHTSQPIGSRVRCTIQYNSGCSG